jgi:plasma kallikrein
MEQCMQQCKATDAPAIQRQTLKIHPATHEPITGCGFRNKNGIGLELTQNNSNIAQFGEFPWHLALSERKNSKFSYICGASLIHPQVALTGAHCVNKKETTCLRIRAGEWDTQTVNEPYPHSDHNVIQTVIHPDFQASNLFNDLALVVLETPVKLSAHINTICLPPNNAKFDGELCFAAGWGADNFQNANVYRVNLKKLQLPLISMKDCQDNLRTTKLGAQFRLHTSFLCAGGKEGIDTCVGKLFFVF